MMIHILYRHTSNVSGVGKQRPAWFSYDKSLNNILSSIEGCDFVKFHLLYDGKFSGDDKRIDVVENFDGGSDWNSYVYAWNYAKNLNINDDDLIFLAENDYAFVKGWPYKVKELFETYDDINYLTLYDHPDFYYSKNYPNLTSFVFPSKTHHWKTVPSSTGSIIFGKKILNEDFDIHTSNPSDRGRFDELKLSRCRNVVSPIPSLSTHCEIIWLAPVVDWEKIY